MKDTTIAVDLAKNVFEIAISREVGKVSKQLRVSRPKLVSFFAKQSAATVLLEACGSAHFWARTLRRLGHDVVLLPPHLREAVSTREQERPRGHQSFARGLPELSQRERSATSNSAARFVVYGKRTLTCMACARSGVSFAVRAATWLDARWPV